MTLSRLLTRRKFLALSAIAGGVAVSTGALTIPATAKAYFNPPYRTLQFINTHTNERWAGTYWVNGYYDRRVMGEFCYILRDHRANLMARIDPRLFDNLFALQCRLQSFEPLQVISAYRSPQTNAWLAAERGGVAKNSYHTRGQAIDIRLPNMPTEYAYRAALSLGTGGVGYYGGSDFIHMDTGPLRMW
jgi:uncharacterized protein YcbK (DUF882 family)